MRARRLKTLIISGSADGMINCGVGQYVFNLFNFVNNKFYDEFFLLTDSVAGSKEDSSNIFYVKNWSFLQISRIYKIIKKIKPDVVHIHYHSIGFSKFITPLLLPAFIKIILRIRIIETWHENFFASFTTGLTMLPAYLAAEKIVTPHKKLFNSSKALFKFFFNSYVNVEFLPGVANIKPYLALKDSNSNFSPNATTPLTVVTFGKISERKKIPNIINFFRCLPQHSRFILVGKVDNNKLRLEDDIYYAARQLGPKIEFLWLKNATDNDISLLLSSADIAPFDLGNRHWESSTTVQASLLHDVVVIHNDEVSCPTLSKDKRRILIRDFRGCFDEVIYSLYKKSSKSPTVSWNETWSKHANKLIDLYHD